MGSLRGLQGFLQRASLAVSIYAVGTLFTLLIFVLLAVREALHHAGGLRSHAVSRYKGEWKLG